LRIVFANNFYYVRGGAERVFFEEMELLRAKGHDVAPFSRRFDKNFDSEYSAYFPSTLEYEGVSAPRKIQAAFKMIYSYESKKRFAELLDVFCPDLVHAHNIYGRLTTSVVDVARKKNVPVVMTLHDLKQLCPTCIMLSHGRICEKCKGGKFYHCALDRCLRESLLPSLIYAVESYLNKLLKKYDWIRYFLLPSRFYLRQYLEAGFEKERLIYAPYPVDTGAYDPNYEPGEYILFAGRLSREKGVMTLIKAVKGLNMPMKIAGEGPKKAELEEFVSENGMNNVVFEGYKAGDELRALFRGAAFVVLPSEWYENSPLTILESFAYGKPVVGSDIGGTPETVVDGETGLLFKPGDENELRAKIEILVDSPAMIEKLGRRARKKVEEEFNAELHYRNLVDIYSKALS
jgi:glycosyltransferase involved in cell wall biosynthesis